MRITKHIAALVALVIVPLAASAAPSPAAITAVDATGKTLSLSAPARRIVSLSPAATETLFAVGAGDYVVGDTTYCDYPVAAATLPKIGGFSSSTISVERILALKPDLVVTAGRIHAPVAEALEKLGIPTFAYAPQSFAAIADAMRTLGSLAATQSMADKAAASLLAALADIEQKIATVKSADRPSVFWEIYDEPLMTAGTATFQHAIVEAGGGRDIFSDLTGSWPRVSAEEVIKRAPAFIMGADDHGDKLTAAAIAARPGWASIPAVREGRIVLLPAAIVSRPTPRIAEGVLAVAKALHPDLFR